MYMNLFIKIYYLTYFRGVDKEQRVMYLTLRFK